MNASTRVVVYGTFAVLTLLGARLLQRTKVPPVPAIAVTAAAVLILPVVYVRVWRQSWLTTTGVITSATEGKKPNPEGRRIVVHQISYDYVVAGQRFAGADTLEFDVTGYDREEEMRSLRETYKEGTSITIYYPRSAPRVNSLTRGVRLPLVIGGIGGLALWVVIAYYWYVALSQWPNKALEPTPTSVTSPAAQEPRQP